MELMIGNPLPPPVYSLTKRKRCLCLVLLGFIVLLSFGLNFFAISKVGFGNAYYAAAVRSMTESFSNFFFVSFDPAGMVSVDKPPLGLWVQALFVMLFGYHGWVMLLPQALAGAGGTLMMYVLTARYFGRPAGLVSSLVFALTPAVVVAARNNTMDTQLIFVLLAATWFLFRSIERKRWRYLFAAAVLIGLGFNIKMLQAYMILPAVVIIYLIFAKESFPKRLLAGGISLVILAAVSLSWTLVVDAWPADKRPYVGSSTDNTVMELIIGHNGMERIYGRGGGGGFGVRQSAGPQNGTPPAMDRNNRSDNAPDGSFRGGRADGGQNGGPGNRQTSPPGENNAGPGGDFGGQETAGNRNFDGGRQGGGAVGNEIGNAGALRLWTDSMYGQASWMILFALFCVPAFVRKSLLKQLTLKQGVFFYWVIWLAAMVLFFSFAGFFHRYYLCMLAPGVAGVAGIGLVEMGKALRQRRGWRRILPPLSLAAATAVNVRFVWGYPDLRSWLVPVILAAAALSLILMAVHCFSGKRVALLASAGCLLISVLAGPFYWSLTATLYVPENITMPYAGPELASQAETPGMTANQQALNGEGGEELDGLERYLVQHYQEGSYLVMAQRANSVAQFIVDTGLPAVAYGGFLGSDNALTLDRLKELVAAGKVTYFLLSEQGGGFGSGSEISSYVRENAMLIDPAEYGGSDSRSVGSLYLFE